MRSRLFLSSLLVFLASTSMVAQSPSDKTHGPDCSGHWPTIMTFVHLKNAGLADNSNVDFSKTQTVRVASEKIGHGLWHQVYHVNTRRSLAMWLTLSLSMTHLNRSVRNQAWKYSSSPNI